MTSPSDGVITDGVAALVARGVEGAECTVSWDPDLGSHGVWTLNLVVPPSTPDSTDGWGSSRQYVRQSDTDTPTREQLDAIAHEMTAHLNQGAAQ